MATNKNFVVKNGLEVGGDIVVTGSLTTSGMSLPASDGSTGQYLQTDGNGNLSWNTVVSSFNVTNGTTTDAVATGETITFTGGTNISISVADNNITFDNDIADSDDITEGATNLFYSNARAIAAIQSAPHLTIDGGTLYVDTTNNYVGIGDTSPAYMLDVGGTTGGGSIAVNGSEVITSAGVFTGSVADSAMTVGGSLVGPLSNLKVQYGTAYNGTPAQGSFFFDSLNQKLKVYTGSAFVDAVPAGTGSSGGTVTNANTTFRKYTYITSTVTNAISGVDVNSETLSYVTDGTENIEVYVNGIKQVEGSNYDYVATTGTSITFTYNLPSGSAVDIQVYEFLSNDAYYVKSEVYTKTETNTQIATGLSSYLPLTGGTVTGALDLNGGLDLNADYNVTEYYKTDATTRLGYLLFRDDGPNYLEFNNTQAGQDFRFASNNNSVLTIKANGNVGIGNNPSYKLDVSGDGRFTNKVRFENYIEFAGTISTPATAAAIYRPADNQLAISTANTQRVLVNASGNIGINTTEQRAKLSIKSSSTSTPVELINLHNPATTNGSGTQLTFSGYGAESAFPTWRYAGISGIYDTTSTGLAPGGWGGKLNFFVNRGNGATAFENILTLSGGGYVGINNETPIFTADITRQGSLQTDILRLKGTTGNSFIRFEDDDSSANWIAGADDNSGVGSGAFIIYDRAKSAYRLKIDTNGNASFHGNYLRLPTASSDPAGVEGALYYNTSTNMTRVYDGNNWGDINIDLSPFSRYNTSSMPHSQVNTQEAGSGKISTYGASAWSVFSGVGSGDFGGHDGHEGTPADYPAYIAIDFGAGISKPVNRLNLILHGNSFGYFELQGSNDAGSGTFYNSGNWTPLTFSTSNNSQGNQNAGGQDSGYSDGTVLTFQYNNSVPYRYYRLWIKDSSQPGESLGTRHAGWATYYWELYRV